MSDEDKMPTERSVRVMQMAAAVARMVEVIWDFVSN